MATWDEKAVFLTALSLQGEEREAFLLGACPDAASRQRIEDLLQHYAASPAEFLSGSQAAAQSQSEPPAWIEEFKIERKLGQGGMGVVYLAQDTILGRPVALKVLATHLVGSERALARFHEEARNAATLRHPAIVPVFKFGFDGTHHYLASEFVDGPTLSAVIEEERKQRAQADAKVDERAWAERCARIAAAIAEALEHSHRSGIVHRDVKPSNILIDPVNGPRLTDFGIARQLTEESKTESADVLGSCHYMSPEQASIANVRIDHRSDIFSLGVVLYEMLTLLRPFDGADVHKVLRAVVDEEPRQVRALAPRCPKNLEVIAHKSLEKNPVNRYQTAAHLAADLRCHLSGDPILARPPNVAVRLGRFAWKRRQKLTLAACLVFASAFGFGAWSRYQSSLQAMAWIDVEAEGQSCSVLAQQVRAKDLLFEPAVSLGHTPLNNVHLQPGVYRITVIADEQNFSEFEVDLAPGEKNASRFIVSEKWKAPTVGERLTRYGRFVPNSGNGMIRIAAGEYDYGWEDPAAKEPDVFCTKRRVLLPEFFIEDTEVSNSQYKKFVDATGHAQPRHWREFGYDPSLADHPVTCISFEDAEAYARWMGLRLPTMYEWQAAARGTAGNLMPDGGAPADRPGLTSEEVAKVGTAEGKDHYELYKRKMSPCNSGPVDAHGLRHTLGNAMEISGSIKPLSHAIAIMGPSWLETKADSDLRSVLSALPDTTPSFRQGFRCARSSAPPVNTQKGTLNAK